MDILPSKRFGITAVFILAAFAGWFFIFGPGNSPETPATTADNSTTENGLVSIQTDSAVAPSAIEHQNPTGTSEQYLRLEGIVFPPSRVERADRSASTSVMLKTYGVALSQALTLYGSKSRINEVELMLRAIEKGSAPEAKMELLGLKAAVETHKAVREALGAMKVPESLITLHAALVTEVSRIEQLVSNMSNPLEDPVLALASAREYRVESTALKSTLVSINNEFTEAGISFSAKEKITVVLYEAN